MSDLVRLSVNLNNETAAALQEMADRNGHSLTETVRRSISIHKYIEDELKAGRTVQVMDRDGGNKVEVELL